MTAAKKLMPPRNSPQSDFADDNRNGHLLGGNCMAFTLSTPTDESYEDTQLGLPVVMRGAQNYWDGSLLIILTAFTAITAVYVSIVLGASASSLLSHATVWRPSMFARLIGSRRVPRMQWLGVLRALSYWTL